MDDFLDLAEFWPEFEAEVRDNLRRLEEGLLQLDEETADSEALYDLMRAAHTIKGAARLMAQERIADLAARIEHALRDVLDGKTSFTDRLKQDLLTWLDDLSEAVDRARPPQAIEPSPPEAPAAEPAPAEAPETPPVSTEEAEMPARPALVPPRVDVAQLDTLTALGTVLHIQHMHLQEVRRQLAEQVQRLAREEKVQAALSAEAIRGLRGLHDRFRAALEEMALTLHSLETTLLDMRLVPFDVLVPVLRRVVRDAARHLGKEVHFEVEGAHIRIDRQLIGPLQDALIHLLRNALDHGIEPPEERRRAGKPTQGHVRVRVESRGGMVTIAVEDDGRGVDIARVREKALERGLVSAAEAATLGERDWLRLLFRPGFTTRGQVGTFSGQGVGLDAVAHVVQRLGGEVDLESTPGQGTTVLLRVPMNLALVDAVVVQVGPHRVAFPLAQVDAVLPQATTPLLTNGARQMVQWQERLVPVLSLAELFPALGGTPAGRHVLIVHSGRQHVALFGGTVVDQVTLALRSLPVLLERVPLVYGASILGDSSVVFLMAVEALVRRLHALTTTEASTEAETSAAARPRRVLVVDDGATTREMLRTALESAGYEVLTAADGRQALDLLQREGTVDLVITDVQMPGMDGIALTRALRRHPAWRSIPIIILTIQSDPEDIRRGLEAGASAYLTKQHFDEGTLLETIEQVL